MRVCLSSSFNQRYEDIAKKEGMPPRQGFSRREKDIGITRKRVREKIEGKKISPTVSLYIYRNFFPFRALSKERKKLLRVVLEPSDGSLEKVSPYSQVAKIHVR